MRWTIALLLLSACMLVAGGGCSSKDPEPQKVDMKGRFNMKAMKPEDVK
jgi:hypothetical protein